MGRARWPMGRFFRPGGYGEIRVFTYDLQEDILELLGKNDVGLLDEDEWGQTSEGKYDCVLYLYGRDARRLCRAIEPILKQSPVAAGGHAIRYGDFGAREEKVTRS